MKKLWWLVIIVVFAIVGVLIILHLKSNSPSLSGSFIGRGSASKLLTQAKDLENKGDLLSSRAVYEKLAIDFSGSNEIANWQKKIEDLNIKLLFSPVVTAKTTLYQIKPGDTLGKIAREFKTTVELIKKSNNLNEDKILPGKKIKVWTAPFSILVDKTQNILILKSGEEVVKIYIVATGVNNSTPVGTFKIVEKLPNPTWFKAGAVVAPGSPENVLGTRWMGFNLAGYGIHGTIEPQSLGKQVTQGCVRMANGEVEELYTIVPKDTEVTIVD